MSGDEGVASPRGDGPEGPGLRRIALTVFLAWILSLGFDLFLHAGLLARIWVRPGAFLLPADEAFRRIPYGYAAFLLLTGGLYWLLRRLAVRGWVEGARMALVVALVAWGTLVLGLYSATTARVDTLLAWWIGQSVELALAGAVIGAALGGASLRRVGALVGVAVVLLIGAVVTLQSTGLAPPMETIPR